MKRRPWPVLLLGLFILLAEPLGFVAINSHLQGESPIQFIAGLARRSQYAPLFFNLILPPILGAAILAMSRWSYPTFIFGAGLLAYGHFELLQEPGSLSFIAASALFTINLLVIAYFLSPQVIALFLNPRLRWWETKTRYIVDFPCRIDRGGAQRSCRVKDFSGDGAFITGTDPLLLGEKVQLRFGSGAFELVAVQGKVVFCKPYEGGIAGFGIQFVEVTPGERRALNQMIEKVKRLQYPTRDGDALPMREDFWSWLVTAVQTGKGWIPKPDKVAPRDIRPENDGTPVPPPYFKPIEDSKRESTPAADRTG